MDRCVASSADPDLRVLIFCRPFQGGSSVTVLLCLCVCGLKCGVCFVLFVPHLLFFGASGGLCLMIVAFSGYPLTVPRWFLSCSSSLIFASVVSYVACFVNICVLSIFVLYLSFFWCLRKTVFRDWGSWVSSHNYGLHCSLRKHAFSNILKSLPPKYENFQVKILIFFIFLLKI